MRKLIFMISLLSVISIHALTNIVPMGMGVMQISFTTYAKKEYY